jgi:hypothetical protein
MRGRARQENRTGCPEAQEPAPAEGGSGWTKIDGLIRHGAFPSLFF